MTRCINRLMSVCAIVVVTAIACDKGPSIHTLDASTTSTLDGERNITNAEKVAPGRLIVSLKMPITESRYALSGPVALVDLPGNPCKFIVGDRADEALHVFTLVGAYVSSVDGAGEADTGFTQLVSGAAAPNGTVVVDDLHNSSLVVIRPGAPRSVFHPSPANSDGMNGSQIGLGADNTIYENWFGRDVPTMSKAWDSSTPLIRAFTPGGRQVAAIGHIVPRDGQLFTAALNRGIVRATSDTIWFARRSDARILAYPVGARSEEPARTINVPIFYRMRPPEELVSTDGKVRNIRLENHIVAFNITPSGDFVLGLATKYPRNQYELFRPTTLIALVSPTGALRKLLDPGGEVIDVLAKPNAIVAIVAHKKGRTVDVFGLQDGPQLVSKATICPHPS